jgi:hypothetical protein
MKKIDLGQTPSIIANVGVITGIMYLGLELQQNSELLGAQARRRDRRTRARQGAAIAPRTQGG